MLLIYRVVSVGRQLMELQSTVEDVGCLPTLSVSDIERHAERDVFTVQRKGYYTITVYTVAQWLDL